MEIKTNMINNSIEDVKSGNKKQKIRGIEFLGKTIGVGEDFGLKSKAVNVIEVCLSDKNRRIRKAAEEALKLIKQREPTSMFDYFQGGVVISSKKKK
jgi:hypothetical protein